MNFVETKTRTLVRTVLWRVIATLITWIVFYIYTGKIGDSIEATIVAALLGITVHYIFERVWNRVRWGKVIEN
jgi:uncharacterized membrane protein